MIPYAFRDYYASVYIIEPDLLESSCIIYDNSNRNIFS